MNTALQVVQEKLNITTIEEFTARLNQDPKKEWLKKTPDGKAEYIPVGIIEMQLRQDFAGLVQFTVISERRELNEYIVTARISVFHPLIAQWMHFDGIGAKVITQKKDTDLADFASHKQKNALEMNAPNAYAEAIKNAAKKIGKKYGADINRQHEDQYTPIYTDEIETDIFMQDIKEKIKACNSLDELTVLWETLPEERQDSVKKDFGFRKVELNNKAA